jgi:CDP-glucose 4,6-dehydratase
MESLGINMDLWRNKSVMITGHTGFKGSWLSLWLSMLGAKVSGYSLQPPTNPSLFQILCLSERVNSIIGDIRNLELLTSTLQKTKPEILIHMAAQALVRASYSDPVGTFSTNIMGTVNILEAVRTVPSVKVVIIVTSDKCYENRNINEGYKESDPMGGYDPYSCSKGCAELVTNAYRKSFLISSHIAVASGRAGNAIGGGDWADDRIVPDFVRAINEGKELNIRSPKATRPWQHVFEPLGGYMKLAEKCWSDPVMFSEGWNFGPDVRAVTTVSDIADRLCRFWGDGAVWHSNSSKDSCHEAILLSLDNNKAREKLGWRPRLSLDQALAMTVDWYRGYFLDKDMSSLSENQISEFMEINGV